MTPQEVIKSHLFRHKTGPVTYTEFFEKLKTLLANPSFLDGWFTWTAVCYDLRNVGVEFSASSFSNAYVDGWDYDENTQQLEAFFRSLLPQPIKNVKAEDFL